jgi:hypothetical protein
MTATAAVAETFDPAATMGLPEPARRWLSHAIPPGTPLWSRAELTMHGQIKLGRWRPFTARQVLTPSGGYIWAATTRLAGLPVTGYDRLGSGSGEMHWRLLRLIPVLNESGSDVTRSAYGRLAGEIALTPTAYRHATWSRGEYANTAVATWQFGDDTETAELRIARSGRLAEVRVNRWGNPGGAPFGRYPFGASGRGRIAVRRDHHPLGVPRGLVVGHRPAARGRVLPGRDHRRGFQLRRHR